MTTCKEQCIQSRCIVQEKNKRRGNDFCGDMNCSSSSSKNGKSGIDEKQIEEFRRIAVCMQKCLSKDGNGKGGSCNIGSC